MKNPRLGRGIFICIRRAVQESPLALGKVKNPIGVKMGMKEAKRLADIIWRCLCNGIFNCTELYEDKYGR